MISFIHFSKINGEPIYIKPENVTAVGIKDGVTVIYTVGDAFPFEVKQEVNDAMELLNSKFV
jgi:hypothetical protein